MLNTAPVNSRRHHLAKHRHQVLEAFGQVSGLGYCFQSIYLLIDIAYTSSSKEFGMITPENYMKWVRIIVFQYRALPRV